MFLKNIISCIVCLVLIGGPGLALARDGMKVLESHYSVDETMRRLESLLEKKGMNIFARIDHSAGAKSAGHELAPTQLLIFGNPSVGTPLMKCERRIAIDLPQKMLVWQDGQGKVWLGYNTPEYLQTRHAVEGCAGAFKKVSAALNKFAVAATGQ